MKKEVLEKLYGSKVELSEVNVELANINDYKKLVDYTESVLKDFNSSYAKLEDTAVDVSMNGKLFLDNADEINKLGATFDKQFKELGLNMLDYPEFKKGSQLLNNYATVRKMMDLANNI